MPAFQIPVQATPDYSDGDAIGPKLALGRIANAGDKKGYITRLTLRSKVAMPKIFVHLFESDPANTAVTDNGALILNAADAAKILKTVTVASTDWLQITGSASPWYIAELVDPANGKGAIPFDFGVNASLLNLYAIFESDGTINFAATTDFMGYMVTDGV